VRTQEFTSPLKLTVRAGQEVVVVERLRRNPQVAYAEPNYLQEGTAKPEDPSFALEWAKYNTGQTIRWQGGQEEFGAWETVNPRSNDPIGAIKDLTHGGADFTLDTSSQPEGRIAAVRSAKVWGTVCFVGERNNVTIDVSPDMLRKQLTIVASWTFSSIGQAECARFIVDRKVDVDRLFTHNWKLDQAEEAYRLFDTQTTGKGVFLM